MALPPIPLQPSLANTLELLPHSLGQEKDLEMGLAPSPRLGPEALSGPRRCPTCGGSGVLRLTAMRFRTCLDCAGQGLLPVVPASSAFEPQAQLGEALDQLMASTRSSRKPGAPASAIPSMAPVSIAPVSMAPVSMAPAPVAPVALVSSERLSQDLPL